MNIYFDTETTGLIPGRVIQLSYIIENGEEVSAKNFFFSVDYVPESAVKVHGFTAEKLYELSGGKVFSDFSDEIQKDFLSADVIIAHNVKFDLNFLSAEYSYLNEIFKYNNVFDTMSYFTPILKLPRRSGGYKYPKLTEVTEFLDIYTYDISKKCIELFNSYDLQPHDARFDTTMLYLAVKSGIKLEENNT